MPPVDFNNLVNDTGDNLSGTFMDKAELQALLMGAAIFNTATGTVHNAVFAGMAGHTVCFWSGAADAAFTGIAGGVIGQRFTFKNIGAKVATFAHNSGSSSAGNKLANYATSAPTPVAPGGSITYRYDSVAWQIVDHEQGAWITAPYVAGNFSGSGAMTWGVDSGDGPCAWRLDGRTLTVAVTLNTTTVGGTLSNALNIGNGAWGGFVAAATVTTATGWLYDGATTFAGYLTSFVGQGNLQVVKLSGANWIAATNLTYVWATLAFPVT